MKSIQDAIMEAVEGGLVDKGFKPLISKFDDRGAIYVSMPGIGTPLESEPAINIAFVVDTEMTRFQLFRPSITPKRWPEGGPDVLEDFHGQV